MNFNSSHMYQAQQWHIEKMIEITSSKLKKNGFNALYVPSKEEALKTLLEMIPLGAKVGVGGSVTVRELGLIEALLKRGTPVADHWRSGLTQAEKRDIRRSQLTCDVFISSTNAVTMDGKLVNVDGTGNRVASMIFGPRKVIIVAGANKIVKDLDAALFRIRNVAAPMNARRLNHKSPCGTTGLCNEEECDSNERLCNIITILERRPSETETTVLLVGEKLGF
jgi:L-lactate utilization protein LutB